MSEIQTDLAKRAAQLAVQVEGLSGSVSALARKQRRDRYLLIGTLSGLCVSLVALVALGFVAVQANNAAKNADSAHAIAVSNQAAAKLTCEAANQSRAQQVELWTHVLDLATQARPPADRARLIATVRIYVQGVFAPRDCSKPITPTPTAPPGTATPTTHR